MKARKQTSPKTAELVDLQKKDYALKNNGI